MHSNCPAMRARSGVNGIVVRMPYTVRFHRGGLIEFDCHWIEGAPVHKQHVAHPVDSPWMRLPQSHMQVFTVGDSRADVWIINSGLYVDDENFMAAPGADNGDKGGSHGNKWLVLPIPHKSRPAGWAIEQGVLSSFLRVSKNVNIPLQLNFTAIPPEQSFIEIERNTPMMQYVPASLPALKLDERPLPKKLADYLVLLSTMHKGGDHRVLGADDEGAYDVMRSYQLKENPGWQQDHIRKPKGAARSQKASADL